VTKKKQYYVIVRGRQPGLYRQWFGEDGAYRQVDGYPEALYRGFYTREEAIGWLRQLGRETLLQQAPNLLDLHDASTELAPEASPEELLQAGKVLIYTDGGAIDNPGQGGYGVVLRYRDHRRELSGGFRLTTNNRMELMACIEGLEALKSECPVVIFSDSAYVVDGMTKSWAERWRSNGWRTSQDQPVKNADLWLQLLDLASKHEIEWRWVRGHAGNPDNERCDRLALAAARDPEQLIDAAYEDSQD
jgi:ribonuclease HI